MTICSSLRLLVAVVAVFPCALSRAQGKSPSPMLDRLLGGSMAGVEEVVFAVRSMGRDGHWYANFG